MFVERDGDGKIVSAFAMPQSELVEDFLAEDNEELLAFLNQGAPTEGEV